jgi:DNA-binding GntR family transcriptional regulator
MSQTSIPTSTDGYAGSDGQSARSEVYRIVKRQILSGELAPGTALSENLLAKQYQVSRTPTREALHRLAIEGLVDVVPKRGTFVAALPSVSSVRQLYEFREAIGGMAARLAARWRTEGDVDTLRLLVRGMEKTKDPEAAGELADEFIQKIDAMSRNELLARANRELMDQIHRLRQTVMKGHGEYFAEAIGKRKRLIDAIEAGDADAAESIAREIVARVSIDAVHMLTER